MRQSKKGKMFSEKRSGSKQIWKEFEIDFKRIWSDFEAVRANLKANLWIQKEEGDFVTTINIKST